MIDTDICRFDGGNVLDIWSQIANIPIFLLAVCIYIVVFLCIYIVVFSLTMGMGMIVIIIM